MAYDKNTARRVRRILSRRRGIVERKMMGTLSFIVNGAMCCCVSGNALMVRVGSEGREQALSEPHVRPMRMGGRPMASFVLVGAEGLRTDGVLARWIKRGIDAGSSRRGR